MYLWNSDNHLGITRITSLLKSVFNLAVNHKKVANLMHVLGIYGVGYHKQTRKYDSSKGTEGTRVKNHLNRRFECDRALQKMVSDVTEFKVPGTLEVVYLETIMDLYNNEILTYAITAGSPNLEFALKPLNELMMSLPEASYKRQTRVGNIAIGRGKRSAVRCIFRLACHAVPHVWITPAWKAFLTN